MIGIGGYFVFMIFVTTTMSSSQNFKDVDIESFLKQILAIHNKYRFKHGAEKLELDNDLSKDADDILTKIYNNQSKTIFKDKGMNIGDGKINEISDLNNEEAKKLFLKWYDTGAGYDYDNEPSKIVAESAAPFTQIVWTNTKKIGMTMAMKDDGTYDIVVIYSPKGNKKNHFKHNVSRRKKK